MEVYGPAQGISAVDAFKKDLSFNINYDAIVMSDNYMVGIHNAASAKELRELGFKGYILCSTDDRRPVKIKHYIDQGANKVVSNEFEWNEVRAVRWGKYSILVTNSRVKCFVISSHAYITQILKVYVRVSMLEIIIIQ